MVNVQMYSSIDAHRAIGLSLAWCRWGWLATKWSSVDPAWWTCSPPWAAASRHGTSEEGSGDILRVRSFDQGLCRRLACRSSMLGSRSLLANRLDLLPNSLFGLEAIRLEDDPKWSASHDYCSLSLISVSTTMNNPPTMRNHPKMFPTSGHPFDSHAELSASAAKIAIATSALVFLFLLINVKNLNFLSQLFAYVNYL